MNKELLDTYIDVAKESKRGGVSVNLFCALLSEYSWCDVDVPISGFLHVNSDGIVLPVFCLPDEHTLATFHCYTSPHGDVYICGCEKHKRVHSNGQWVEVVSDVEDTPETPQNSTEDPEKLSIGEYVETLSEDPVVAPMMTKLDMFAIEAMKVVFKDVVKGTPYTDVASLSYDMAEIMLAESEARNG